MIAKYPYYSPNLFLWDVLKATFTSKASAEERLKNYFAKLTGKKYILITNSCRTALYIAYRSMGKTGAVITSPLTCKVAIDPIEESVNTPTFADVGTRDLNINPQDIAHRITPATIAIQPIHQGGVVCEMDAILDIARQHSLMVIEDCAQSLGATYKGANAGSFGDVACFSLIKNAYGIGGGILATNNEEIYRNACNMEKGFDKIPRGLLVYRVIRNILDTSRQNFFGQFFFNILMKAKGKKKSYDNVTGQLKRVSNLEVKIAFLQLKKYRRLHSERQRSGKQFVRKLESLDLMKNTVFSQDESSFTKFFIYHPSFDSQRHLTLLNAKGIEAMHLEQRAGSPVQERLVDFASAQEKGLVNYNKTHDHLISLPLCEWFSDEHIDEIMQQLKETIHTL